MVNPYWANPDGYKATPGTMEGSKYITNLAGMNTLFLLPCFMAFSRITEPNNTSNGLVKKEVGVWPVEQGWRRPLDWMGEALGNSGFRLWTGDTCSMVIGSRVTPQQENGSK